MASGNAVSKTAVWILMGLLIVGLGGFGVTNLGGTIRSVGTVGDAEIDIVEYSRALQNEIRAEEAATGQRMTFAQAQAKGIDLQVLAQLVNAAAIEDETARLGISVGDAAVRNELMAIPGFSGAGGTFNRQAYQFTLEQAGMTEGQFEENLRSDTASTLLQGAVIAGIRAPETYVDTLITYLGERRDITWATLDRGDLVTGLPAPTESDLRSYHQSNLPDFTTPLTKVITYAWLTPEMIIDTVDVDEAALRAAYDERIDEFQQPERRLVERLVLADQAAADAARAALDSGETRFENLVEARGLSLADIDLGDVTQSDLDDAGAAVFGVEPGEIVGPLPTALGPALFRVNGTLAAQNTSFEDAEPMLRDALVVDRARRVVDNQIEGIDDMLAGGATVEDLARDTDMELGTIAWYPGETGGIGAYEAFRTAAAALKSGDFPQVEALGDGGIFAMRLDKIDEPRILPVDEVRDALIAAWTRDAVAAALRAQAEPQLSELAAGAEFADLGYANVQSATDVTRRGFEADAPPEFIETVFGMEQGEARIIDGAGRIFILRLDRIQPPDAEDEDLTALRGILATRASNGLSQDLLQVLGADIRSRVGISLDQRALNAVHSNFQ